MAVSSFAGTEKSRLTAILTRSSVANSLPASSCRHSAKASECRPRFDALTASSSRAAQVFTAL